MLRTASYVEEARPFHKVIEEIKGGRIGELSEKINKKHPNKKSNTCILKSASSLPYVSRFCENEKRFSVGEGLAKGPAPAYSSELNTASQAARQDITSLFRSDLSTLTRRAGVRRTVIH